MASISVNLPRVPPVTPPLNVGAVAVTAPVALVAAGADAQPLPVSRPLAPAAPAADLAQDGAAMRPDQVLMARQLSFQRADAGTLGSSWRSMIRHYRQQLLAHEQQALAGRLAPAQLVAGQDGRVLRQPDPHSAPADAWRFTVHAGGPQPQRLSVIADEPDQPPGRRRHPRAALRLELELADATRVTVQVEPMPGGVALELCATDPGALARLRELQPVLEKAVTRAGLRVQRWNYRDRIPAGPVHAAIASYHAERVLTLPVFRAVAELALLLPVEPQDAPQE